MVKNSFRLTQQFSSFSQFQLILRSSGNVQLILCIKENVQLKTYFTSEKCFISHCIYNKRVHLFAKPPKIFVCTRLFFPRFARIFFPNLPFFHTFLFSSFLPLTTPIKINSPRLEHPSALNFLNSSQSWNFLHLAPSPVLRLFYFPFDCRQKHINTNLMQKHII